MLSMSVWKRVCCLLQLQVVTQVLLALTRAPWRDAPVGVQDRAHTSYTGVATTDGTRFFGQVTMTKMGAEHFLYHTSHCACGQTGERHSSNMPGRSNTGVPFGNPNVYNFEGSECSEPSGFSEDADLAEQDSLDFLAQHGWDPIEAVEPFAACSQQGLDDSGRGARLSHDFSPVKLARKRRAADMEMGKGAGPDKNLFFNMLKLQCTGVPWMPWTTGLVAHGFKKGPCRLPMPWLSMQLVGRQSSLQGPVPSAEPPERMATMLVDLSLAVPSHMQLSRALLDLAGQLTGEDMSSCVFADVFRNRAMVTLVKQSLDYYKLALWMRQWLSLQLMQLTESVVHQCVSFLRETGAAPTLADATVKAFWFMHVTATITDFSPKVFTSRITGVCRDIYWRKRLLRQAPPFPAEIARALEVHALDAESKIDFMFTNFILFCIFSSRSIGNAAKIREVESSRLHDTLLVEVLQPETIMEVLVRNHPYMGWQVWWFFQGRRVHVDLPHGCKCCEAIVVLPRQFESFASQTFRMLTSVLNLEFNSDSSNAARIYQDDRHLLDELAEPLQQPGDWAESESDVSDEDSFSEGGKFVEAKPVPANSAAGQKPLHKDSLVVHVKRDNQTPAAAVRCHQTTA